MKNHAISINEINQLREDKWKLEREFRTLNEILRHQLTINCRHQETINTLTAALVKIGESDDMANVKIALSALQLIREQKE